MFKSIIKPFYLAFKKLSYKIFDFYDELKRTKNPLIPPRSMIYIGDGDYEKTGKEFLGYFIELGHIMPNSKILDIGCGIGRMAVPITKYLTENGEYHGFDIVKMGINWANENITSRYPNFYFKHSNIFNQMYNPQGIVNSSNYTFEYSNDYFDFVFLTSVFTHMYAIDVERYIYEISRVMKSKARCLITMFILNDESKDNIKRSKSDQNLIYRIDNVSFTKDQEIPESAIGFDEDYIKLLFKKNGLMICDSIHYGSWCGRKNYLSYQDIIVAEKL